MIKKVLTIKSEEHTFALGRVIGQHAQSGDVVCLIGDLGAGKTVLAQGIGEGLGIPDSKVNSPTYTIVAERPGGRLPLYHFDLYRIKAPHELIDVAADEYLEGQGLCVVEWADLALDALGPDLLRIVIEFGEVENERIIDMSATGPTSERLLEHVAESLVHL